MPTDISKKALVIIREVAEAVDLTTHCILEKYLSRNMGMLPLVI